MIYEVSPARVLQPDAPAAKLPPVPVTPRQQPHGMDVALAKLGVLLMLFAVYGFAATVLGLLSGGLLAPVVLGAGAFIHRRLLAAVFR